MNNLVVAPSFNGRTADSGSAYRGSNPWGAANSRKQRFFRRHHRQDAEQRAVLRVRQFSTGINKNPVWEENLSNPAALIIVCRAPDLRDVGEGQLTETDEGIAAGCGGTDGACSRHP